MDSLPRFLRYVKYFFRNFLLWENFVSAKEAHIKCKCPRFFTFDNVRLMGPCAPAVISAHSGLHVQNTKHRSVCRRKFICMFRRLNFMTSIWKNRKFKCSVRFNPDTATFLIGQLHPSGLHMIAAFLRSDIRRHSICCRSTEDTCFSSAFPVTVCLLRPDSVPGNLVKFLRKFPGHSKARHCRRIRESVISLA